MARLTFLDRTARGLVAGVAGTVAMTAWQELSAKLQSSEGDAGEEPEDGPQDPWAAAPAPAKVGRVILGGLGYVVPASKIGPLTTVMHWGYGTTWGAVYGAMLGNVARERPLARGLAFGTWVWIMSYVQLVPLGIYQPPWRYSPKVLAMDLSYHLAYGAGVGVGGALIES
jgi:hypothetical protein